MNKNIKLSNKALEWIDVKCRVVDVFLVTDFSYLKQTFKGHATSEPQLDYDVVILRVITNSNNVCTYHIVSREGGVLNSSKIQDWVFDKLWRMNGTAHPVQYLKIALAYGFHNFCIQNSVGGITYLSYEDETDDVVRKLYKLRNRGVDENTSEIFTRIRLKKEIKKYVRKDV